MKNLELWFYSFTRKKLKFIFSTIFIGGHNESTFAYDIDNILVALIFSVYVIVFDTGLVAGSILIITELQDLVTIAPPHNCDKLIPNHNCHPCWGGLPCFCHPCCHFYPVCFHSIGCLPNCCLPWWWILNQLYLWLLYWVEIASFCHQWPLCLIHYGYLITCVYILPHFG